MPGDKLGSCSAGKGQQDSMVSGVSCRDNQVSPSRACVEHKENRPYHLFYSIEQINQTAIFGPKTGSIKTLENTSLVPESPPHTASEVKLGGAWEQLRQRKTCMIP